MKSLVEDPAEDTDSCSDDSDDIINLATATNKNRSGDEKYGVELKLASQTFDTDASNLLKPVPQQPRKQQSPQPKALPNQIILHPVENMSNYIFDSTSNDGNNDGEGSVGSNSAVTLPSMLFATSLGKKRKDTNAGDEGTSRRSSLRASLGKFTKRAMRSRASIWNHAKEMKFESRAFDDDDNDNDNEEDDQFECADLPNIERVNSRWSFRKSVSNTSSTEVIHKSETMATF